jgi:NAD(P)-dependent dehydrogenase (short-subunit alcohol dehydrogenase family)
VSSDWLTSSTIEGSGLRGQPAVITGGASGIGRAVAVRFVREGMPVAILDANRNAGEETLARLRRIPDAKVEFYHADVTDEASVHEACAQASAAFGATKVLITSAGIGGPLATLDATSTQDFDRLVAVNLRGTFLVMKQLIPIMQAHGGGSIVCVASAAAFVGAAGRSAYCATKAGVIELARVAAVEYAQSGIRVNAVCPGIIDTPMVSEVTASYEAQHAEPQPIDNVIQRMGTPEEVAEAVAFLASPRASFMYGTPLIVDGGKLAR